MKGYITPKLDISVLDLQDILTESSGSLWLLDTQERSGGGAWDLTNSYQ